MLGVAEEVGLDDDFAVGGCRITVDRRHVAALPLQDLRHTADRSIPPAGMVTGRVLAQNIAVRLQAAGEQVESSVMLDPHHQFDEANFRELAAEMLASIGIHDVDPDRLIDLSDDDLEVINANLGPQLAAITLDQLRRIYRSGVGARYLLGSHHPGIYHGTADYIRATEDVPRSWDAVEAWRPYVSDIAEHPIDLPHDALLSEPGLALIGRIFRRKRSAS